MLIIWISQFQILSVFVSKIVEVHCSGQDLHCFVHPMIIWDNKNQYQYNMGLSKISQNNNFILISKHYFCCLAF